MALSMLQDAQNSRALGMKQQHNDDDRSMSCSPPILNHSNSISPHPMMNTSTPISPVFHGFHHHGHHMPATTQNSMRILAPHLLANQTAAAAALMAAGLPMSLRATLASSGLFSPHHALFGGWATNNNNDGLVHNNNNNNNSTISPAPSPTSPILNNNNNKRNMNNNNNSHLANNNHIVSTTTDHLPMNPKKGVKRKQTQQNIKKELEMPRDMISPGPISPPTSGSSPQSTDSIENPNLSVLSTTSSNPPPTTVIPNTARGPSDMLRDKVFTCKICNRSFGYKHVLQNHERTHTGEKPFECPECHKRFTRDHHLKTHMRLHTGEKPYHCSHCDRQFVQVANLRRHLRVHTGERPYQCDLCEARFSDSNQLKAHILIHNGEKPFQCERCHSRFRRRHHLLHHKCGLTSPPTPAISPVMSLSDVKSERSSSIRSETSDESLDLTNPNKPKSLNYLHNQVVPIPLDLSHMDSPIELTTDIKRNRKSRDIRRLIRLPQQIMHMACPNLPEQTEPEDLRIHIPRSPESSLVSHDDDDVDLDDLDDAATLYIKQKINGQRINI